MAESTPLNLSPTASETSSLSDYPEEIEDEREMLEHMRAVSKAQGSKLEVVQGFLRHTKPGTGRKALVQDVLKADNSGLQNLNQVLKDHILIPLKAAGGKTVAPTPHTPAIDKLPAYLSTIESSSRNDQEHLRKKCLSRDGFRCVVTEFVDWNHRSQYPDQQSVQLDCAHIIPFGLANFDEANHAKMSEKAQHWLVLLRYFPEIRHICGIESGTINKYSNAMMLEHILHRGFGAFAIYFESESNDGTNKYRVMFTDQFPSFYQTWLPASQKIEFVSHDPFVELPCRAALQTHAVIAKVFSDGGLGERIQAELEQAIETMGRRGLTSDGSTTINPLWWNLDLKLWP